MIQKKGLLKTIYIFIIFLILWLFNNHICPKSNFEFLFLNINISLPFIGINLRKKHLPFGEIIPNCGLELPCPENHFSVHLHTGRSIIDKPKICIDGKYIIHEKLKNGMRGFNVVVVDSSRKEAIAANGFDSGHRHSKELEAFLDYQLKGEDIVIGMTYDEASTKLSHGIKRHFAILGSGLIQNLQPKDQWYLISQKGIDGFSPFEEIQPYKRGQFDFLSRRFCVPTKIKGQVIIPDPPVQNNYKRKKFCNKHPELEEFCSASHVLDDLKAGLLLTPKHNAFPFYHSPVIVLAFNSLSSLSLTFETILAQSGIQPQNVRVVYNSQKIKDVPHLCSLFGFKPLQTKAKEFSEMLKFGLDSISKEFAQALYVSVIEEGTLLSPDYSLFTSQVIKLLDDPRAIGVTAWNPNGFVEVSSRHDLLFRMETLTWLVLTFKLKIYSQFLKGLLNDCCNKRGVESWILGTPIEGRYVIYPDVSRCYYISKDNIDRDASAPSLSSSLFHRERRTSLIPSTSLDNLVYLHSTSYDAYLFSILKSNGSRQLNINKDQILSFYNDMSLRMLSSYLSNTNGMLPMFVLPFIEAKVDTNEGLKTLCRCFGLFYYADWPPMGVYKGTIRFSVNGVEFMFLSSLSPFFHTFPYNFTSLILP